MNFQTLHELFEAGVANLRSRNIGALYPSSHDGVRELSPGSHAVGERSIAGEFLGHTTPTPIMIAPWGSQQVTHDSAEIGSAKGAGDNFMALSTASNTCPREVMAVSDGPRLFQLCLFAGGAWLDDLVERVIDLGFAGIVLTVDVAMPDRCDPSLDLPSPRSLDFPHPLLDAAFNDPTFDPSFPLLAGIDWAWVNELQAKIAGRVPFGLQGIMTGQDAARAQHEGVEFIWVSNHGGRQHDSAPAAIDALPAIVHAIKAGSKPNRGPKPQIVVDGGFRRGAQVLQALALGADMVAMSTTFQMALAADGEAGVATAFELLAAELDTNLALTGHTNIYDLTPEDIVRILQS